MPLVTQTHSQNICVTGGYVYRGRAIPSLVGTYLFGDCLAGHVYEGQLGWSRVSAYS